ncbi:MAG: Ig-like domain-containing protein [bacterium]|nr:Ig-like domain-containing protein [bacterium]
MTMKTFFLFFIALLLMTITGYGDVDKDAPFVIETFPKHGLTNVDPSVTAISVTFSKPMYTGDYAYGNDYRAKFPTNTGKPYYSKDAKKHSFPVKLEPNTKYILWINSHKLIGFKDKTGNPAIPFILVFKTRK